MDDAQYHDERSGLAFINTYTYLVDKAAKETRLKRHFIDHRHSLGYFYFPKNEVHYFTINLP